MGILALINSFWGFIAAAGGIIFSLIKLFLNFYDYKKSNDAALAALQNSNEAAITAVKNDMKTLEGKSENLEKELRQEVRAINEKIGSVATNISLMTQRLEASNLLFEKILDMHADKFKEQEERNRELYKQLNK